MNTLLLQLVNRPVYFRIASYIWLGLTCYLLFKPDLGFDRHVLFPGEDKAAHLILFGNLTFLWALNFRFALLLHRKMVSWLVLTLGVFFALGSELIQEFLPKRSMDLEDVLYDLIGIFFGYFLFFFIEKRINTSREKLIN